MATFPQANNVLSDINRARERPGCGMMAHKLNSSLETNPRIMCQRNSYFSYFRGYQLLLPW